MPECLAEAHVNRFRNSFDSTPTDTLTLREALEAIRSETYQAAVDRVRRVLARDGKAAYDRAKAHLPPFTFGGTFAPSRGNAHLQRHSGIVHGDLDHLSDVDAVKHAISDVPHTAYVFTSPSGTGLKIGVHVPIAADDAAYKHAWAHVAKAYEVAYDVVWDPSGKDVSRLCFVSHDPTAYWNPDVKVFPVSPLPPPTPRAPQRSVSRQGYRDQRYAERALDTAVRMIETAELGTRHHTRLKAARLLGGYVAGGLLTDNEAYGALAQALVGHTENLERALKTIDDGLAYGKAHLITLEALEAERRAWLEQHFPRHRNHPVPGDEQGLILLPLRPYAPYRGPRKGGWHG